MNITASGGGIAAGVIHGRRGAARPYGAGSGAALAVPGDWNLGPGTIRADRGGTAIGTLAYQRRPEVAGMPVRLAPRPVFLAGPGGAAGGAGCPAARVGTAGPQVVALCGLGGAGKTSVAVEYAHRHLAEVGVCWQFAAKDPAVLAAEFGGAGGAAGGAGCGRCAGSGGVGARGAGPGQAGWLLVFDNVADRASVERFVPPAGHGRVLITTQNQHWPRGQAAGRPGARHRRGGGLPGEPDRGPDRPAARELAQELGGLPLALEQAAAYMQATGTTLAARYLSLFRDRQADLLARGEAAGHPADVAATLGLALSRLEGQAPGAAGLLRLLAFLAPEPVPLALLLPGRGCTTARPAGSGPGRGRCSVTRSRPGTRSPRCAVTPCSTRPGTAWCWCTGWCRPSPAPSSRRRRPPGGSRLPRPWSRPPSPPTRAPSAWPACAVAAAACPGRPGPDQRRHVADRAVSRA